jgi:hypothetical protein
MADTSSVVRPDDAGGQFAPVGGDVLDVELAVGLAGGKAIRGHHLRQGIGLGSGKGFHLFSP